MKNLHISGKYSFHKLEKYLIKVDSAIMLRLFDERNKQHCLMWVFRGNFSKEYQSGDAILFYDDGETHSANPDDRFVFKEILSI